MSASSATGASSRRRRAWRWLGIFGLAGLGAVLLGVLGVLAGWFLLLDERPALDPGARVITPGAVEEAVQGLRALDPRRRAAAAQAPQAAMAAQAAQAAQAGPDVRPAYVEPAQAVKFSAATVDLLSHDLARRLLRGSAAAVRLAPEAAELQLSLPLSAAATMGFVMPAGRWANVRLTLQARPQGLPQLRSMALGGLELPVPAGLPAWLIQAWAGERRLQQLRLAASLVDHVGLDTDGMELRVAPPDAMARRFHSSLLPGVDAERLQAHHAALMHQAALPAWASAGSLPLGTAMVPLLLLATQRAAASTDAGLAPTPIAAASAAASPWAAAAAAPAPISAAPDDRRLALETRHALMALSLWALGIDPKDLLPDRSWAPVPQPRPTVTLRGRADHALHFLLSAVLAMGAQPAVADVMGLYKELADLANREGSGFSVDDLLADRAGTVFGDWALRHPRALAAALPRLADDASLMPPADGLPSGLDAAAFRQRFHRVDSPAYRLAMAEVERRVSALPLYRAPDPAGAR